MAIVFPVSPTLNDTFVVGSITYKWDGDKWIGLGVTPADRLIEGSNSLEIDANNNLVWSGGNLLVGKPAGNFVLDVEKSDENTLRLSNSAETTHGSHDTKLVSGRSFYSNFLLQASSYKFQTWNGSAIDNRLVIDSTGRLLHGTTYNNEWGAGLVSHVAQPITDVYFRPSGQYTASLGHVTNTNTTQFISVDSSYNQTSAVSAGIFLSAFHADLGGSNCGFTIKNLKSDPGGLAFSSVTTATTANNPANEVERLRISSTGQVSLKSQTTSDQLHLAKTTGFGYDQGTYRVLQIGKTTAASGSPGTNQTLSFNYDPSGNTSGQFTGLGSEILVANNTTYNTTILQPKSNNVGYNLLFTFGPNGEVRQPSKPSFLARTSAASTTWNVNSEGWQKIPFDTETNGWDQTSNYDAANSRFTAPVAGKYLFGCELQLESPSYSGNPWMYITFLVNGQTGAFAQGGTRTDVALIDFYNSYSTVHLFDLAAGDYVEMWRTGNMTSIIFKGGSESAFWGYLVG